MYSLNNIPGIVRELMYISYNDKVHVISIGTVSMQGIKHLEILFKDNSRTKDPIVHWALSDMERFIEADSLDIPNLYDLFHKFDFWSKDWTDTEINSALAAMENNI